LIKNCNLLISRSPLRTPNLQENPSALKREHPALQNMKIQYFFLFLWVIFALLDPDPDPQFVCGSDPDLAAQINADPDPDTDRDLQPWFRVAFWGIIRALQSEKLR
jgi:hypothetical protein